MELETDPSEYVDDPSAILGRQPALQMRIRGVQREADGHRLAVAHTVVRQLLQLVRRPVAEIQRPTAARLERIASPANVRDVQRRAAVDELAGRARRARARSPR